MDSAKALGGPGRTTGAAAVAYMVLSTASFAFSGLFAERASSGGDVRLTLFARFAIPLILTLPFLLPFGQQRERLHVRNLRAHVARAIFLVASQYCFFVTTIHTSLYQAMILYNTGPLFILLFSQLFLGNKWSGRRSWATAAAVGLGFVGTVLTLWHGIASADPYAFVGVGSGVLLALSQLTLHHCAQNEPSSHTMLWTYALSTGIATLPLLAAPSGALHILHGGPFPSVQLGAAILMALGSLGNQFFRSHAYKHVVDPATISPLLYLTIVFSLLFDVTFNGHVPSALAVFGGTMILAGPCVPATVRWVAKRDLLEQREQSRLRPLS